MTRPTCMRDDCERESAARGLCCSHYSTWHRSQYGRKKFSGECGWCGSPFTSTDQRTQACCVEHGLWLRGGTRTECAVPDDHPSRSTPVPADHPSRQPPYASHPVWYGDCDECGRCFSSNTPVKVYCSLACQRRVGRRLRRSREHGQGDSFRWVQVVALFLAFDRCCAYCRQPIDGQPDPDHVVPLSRGGHNTISNILPSCRKCNGDKRDLTLREWAADRARRGKPAVHTTWDVSDRRYAHLALRTASPLAA